MKAVLRTSRGPVEVQGNAIDRIVNYLDPVRGMKRLQARMMGAIAGGYTGAARDRRSMKTWTPLGTDPDSAILPDLPTLRERSRDLERNAPLACGVFRTVCTNVVGVGLKMQCRIDRDFLGMTEEQATAWQKNTEREWRFWSGTAECDAERGLSFVGMQNMALHQALLNGDVFALLPNVKRKGSPYGLKVQLIEGDRVCNKDHTRDTDKLAGGVQRGEYGDPIAYHVMDQHPGAIYFGSSGKTWTVVPAYGVRTGRKNVLHLFVKHRPGQPRGVPYLAPIIETLKQLDRYTEAEIDAAVISGMFTVFIKQSTPGGDAPTLGEMTGGGTGGSSTGTDDYKLESGAIIGLPDGTDISTANPGRPNTAFDPFVQAILRQIGVALELPFEVLVKHFTASYSAARAALNEAWRFYLGRREWLIAGFCQPIYEAWMDEAVALGRVKAPGYFADPLIRQAYLGSTWIGPAPTQLDPLKEVNAAEKRINIGISTIADETASSTGGDFDQNIPQIKKERRMLKEAGLTPEPKPGAAQPPPPSPDDNPNPDGPETPPPGE